MTATILDCGHAPTVTDGPGTGYGTDLHGKTFCYACAGERDKQNLRDSDRATLYVSKDSTGQWQVTNWPGSLKIPIYRVKSGRHNIARTRLDTWFSFEGSAWHGVNIGDNDILRCRKLKGA